MANNLAGNVTAAAEPAADFCRDYVLFLFSAGKWTLIAGILLGIALAIATIILLLRKKEGAADEIRTANAATPTAVLDAVKGFLQALSSAPTWLALFGGGVLLLWMAGNAIPERCTCQLGQPGCTQQPDRANPSPAPGTRGRAGETANQSSNLNNQ